MLLGMGIVFLAVALISFSSANKLLCLGYGQSVPSEENKKYTCWHDICQICVNDNNYPGVNPSSCKEACVPFGDADFELDVTPPELVVSSPVEGGLYSSRKVLFDVDSNEPFSLYYLDNINGRGRWKRLGANLEDYSRAVSLKDGFNNVTILGRDRNNNAIEFVRTFVVDSKKPKISSIEPRRGATGGLLSLEFIEENPKEIVLTLLDSFQHQTGQGQEERVVYDSDWIAGNCVSDVKRSERKRCEFDERGLFEGFDPTRQGSSGASGEVSYSFSVEDVVGNVYEKVVKSIVVDSVAPEVLNEGSFWEQGTGRYAKYVYFDLEIVEENLDEVSYVYVDSRGRERTKRLCSRLKDPIGQGSNGASGVCEVRKSFRSGEYIDRVEVLDEAGNEISLPIGIEI